MSLEAPGLLAPGLQRALGGMMRAHKASGNSDGKHRIAVAYVGEGGIEPDTWYRVDETGKLVKAAIANDCCRRRES